MILAIDAKRLASVTPYYYDGRSCDNASDDDGDAGDVVVVAAAAVAKNEKNLVATGTMTTTTASRTPTMWKRRAKWLARLS